MLAGAHTELIKLIKHGWVAVSHYSSADFMRSWILSDMVKVSFKMSFRLKYNYSLADSFTISDRVHERIAKYLAD